MPVLLHQGVLRRPALHRFVRRDLLKALLPYAAWLTYCIMGSIVFYLLETSLPQFSDHRASSPFKCITTFASAFFFTMAATTTIGFGVVYPCTSAGRFLSVLYIACGLPQFVIVLLDVGAKLCAALRHCILRRRRRRIELTGREAEKLVATKVSRALQLEDEEIDIPVSIGIVPMATCVIVCAIYYITFEDHPFWEATYASSLTFLAGDYVATNFPISSPFYSVVLIGFAMLSLTIQIVQNNIENLVKRTKRRVSKRVDELRDRIATGKVTTADAASVVEAVLVEEETSKSGLYGVMISKNRQSTIVRYAADRIERTAVDLELENTRQELIDTQEALLKSTNTRRKQKSASAQTDRIPAVNDAVALHQSEETIPEEKCILETFLPLYGPDLDHRYHVLSTEQSFDEEHKYSIDQSVVDASEPTVSGANFLEEIPFGLDGEVSAELADSAMASSSASQASTIINNFDGSSLAENSEFVPSSFENSDYRSSIFHNPGDGSSVLEHPGCDDVSTIIENPGFTNGIFSRNNLSGGVLPQVDSEATLAGVPDLPIDESSSGTTADSFTIPVIFVDSYHGDAVHSASKSSSSSLASTIVEFPEDRSDSADSVEILSMRGDSGRSFYDNVTYRQPLNTALCSPHLHAHSSQHAIVQLQTTLFHACEPLVFAVSAATTGGRRRQQPAQKRQETFGPVKLRQRKHDCPLCDEKFDFLESLKVHLQAKHPQGKQQ